MDSYIGSLMLVPYNFAPRNYAFCAGQILSIAQNTALFSLLGTYYGGNGQTTFGLPDLRGRVALSQGQGPGLSDYSLGEAAGSPTITLNAEQQPAHTHTMSGAKGAGSGPAPAGAALAQAPIYSNAITPITILNPQSITTMPGGGGPHNNMMPYQGLNWIICTQGLFPPRS